MANAKSLVVATLVLTSGPALALDVWDGGSSASDDWSDGRNWVGNRPPGNNGLAQIVMTGGQRLVSVVDQPWSIRSLLFDGAAAQFTITGQQLTIGVSGIENLDSMPHLVGSPVELGASQSWHATNGDLDILGGIDLNGFTLTFDGPEDTDILPVHGVGDVVKRGSGTLLMVGSSNTYDGTTTVLEGTLLLGNSITSIPGALVIGEMSGDPGDAVVRLLEDDVIADGPDAQVTIKHSGVLDLDSPRDETITKLTLEGGAVAGFGTLVVEDEFVSIAHPTPSTCDARIDLDGFLPVTVGDGAADDDLAVSTMFNGTMRKLGAGTLVLILPQQDTTQIHEGTFAIAANSVNQIGGAIVVGDGIGGVDADVFEWRRDNVTASGAVLTINESGLANLNGHRDVVTTVMNGGRIDVPPGGRLAFGSLTVNENAQSARIDGEINCDGAATVLIVADGPPVDDLILSGGRIGTDSATVTKRGPGQVSFSGFHGDPRTIIEEGTVVLRGTSSATVISDVTVGDGVATGGLDTLRWADDSEVWNSNGLGDIVIESSGFADLAGFTDAILSLLINGGRLALDGGDLTIVEDAVMNGGQIDLGVDGALEASSGLAINGGSVVGTGTITVAGEIVNGGCVEPGASPGLITVDGGFRQVGGGAVIFEIAAADPAAYDRIAVTGDVSFNGGSLEVVLIEGFEPAPGDAFEIMTAGSVSGFVDVDVHLPEGMELVVGPDGIVAEVPSACIADLDGSGSVDFGDVLAILGAWGNAGGPEDLDNSGTVNFSDLLLVLAAWGPCA